MKVLFTCGGTAGHVNPALAVAQTFEKYHPGCQILFVGAEKGMEKRLVEQAGYPIRCVKVSTFERQMSWKVLRHNFKSVFKVPVGQWQASRILHQFKPDLVVGTGGYASFPAVREATRLGIPTAIHESNAYPGLTTRVLSKRVDLVMVGFPEAAAFYSHAKKVAVTGTPVRGAFFRLNREQARRELGLEDDKPLVMSFWGSQGARYMNQMTENFVEKWVHDGRPFHYIHSAGRDYQAMSEHLQSRGISVTDQEVRPYIDNMPTVMAAADLVICRAGASTLGELTAMGKPAMLVPSPYVAANHQFKNAKVLADRGAAQLVDEKSCSGEQIYQMAAQLLGDAQRRGEMSRAMKELATPRAAEDIYQALQQIL